MKQFIKKNIIIIISVVIGFIKFSLDKFVNPIAEIGNNFNAGSFFFRYVANNMETYNNATNNTKQLVIDIVLFVKNFDFKTFLIDLMNLILTDSLMYISMFINMLIIVYILVDNFINKSEDKIYKTRLAKLNIKFNNSLSKFKRYIKNFLVKLKNRKKQIYFGALVILFLKGILISIIIETVIFTYYYLVSVFDYTTYMHLMNIAQTLVIILFNLHPVILFIIIILTIFYISYSRAIAVLEKNYNSLVAFSKFDTGFITIFNGKPDAGKTRSIVNLGLAYLQVIIRELKDILSSIESQYPNVNWAVVEMDQIKHYREYPDHMYYTIMLHEKTTMLASAPLSVIDPW